jgi:hypothetical protein
MRSSSIAEALEAQRLGASTTDELGRTDALVHQTAEALISWNLTKGGVDVPATYEGLAAQQGFIFWAIFNAWVEAITGVSVPLDGGSTSGDSSLEASIPMEPLSPSPSS